jgi:hypothetical protein
MALQHAGHFMNKKREVLRRFFRGVQQAGLENAGSAISSGIKDYSTNNDSTTLIQPWSLATSCH